MKRSSFLVIEILQIYELKINSTEIMEAAFKVVL